jgi:hypothetical protein
MHETEQARLPGSAEGGKSQKHTLPRADQDSWWRIENTWTIRCSYWMVLLRVGFLRSSDVGIRLIGWHPRFRSRQHDARVLDFLPQPWCQIVGKKGARALCSPRQSSQLSAWRHKQQSRGPRQYNGRSGPLGRSHDTMYLLPSCLATLIPWNNPHDEEAVASEQLHKSRTQLPG